MDGSLIIHCKMVLTAYNRKPLDRNNLYEKMLCVVTIPRYTEKGKEKYILEW